MKNTLKEFYKIAQIMSYEDWRKEISYRLTGKFERITNKEIVKKLDLHIVSNCDYCDKETDKLIDENGFNYCEDCYMR